MPTVSGTWLFFATEIQTEKVAILENVKFHYDRTECTMIHTSTIGIGYRLIDGTDIFPYRDGEWEKQEYRIITFINEQTVSDKFYEWFTTYAVQDNTDVFVLSGKWKFNEVIAPLENRAPGKVNTVYRVNYTYYMDTTAVNQTAFTQYDNHELVDDVVTLTESQLWFGAYSGITLYNFLSNTWLQPTRFDRVVDFGETEQTVDRKLYSWITENAKPVGVEVPTEITYNGVATSVDVGKTATFECNGRKMKSDIVVVFGSDGSIIYNGTESVVKSAQTATLHCRDKIMKSDVVITL